MKIKGFLARVSVVLAVFLSQSLADSSNEIDSNSGVNSNNELDSSKQVKKKILPPPYLQILRIAQVVSKDSKDSRDSNKPSKSTTDSSESDDYETIDIGTSIIRAKAEYETYQSGSSVSKQVIDSTPNGNGDITSILKMLPNVQFSRQQNRSSTPGEIDPADIQISGGLFYQNNFQLDGFNINNDLDPANGSSYTEATALPGRSQGFNIDTSLLDSIMVIDSNASAAYGGFTGGVVEANTKRATKKFGANISYQISQGNANPTKRSLTQYHIYAPTETNYQNFLNSTSAGN